MSLSMPRLQVFVACIFSLAAIALAAQPVTYIFGDSLTDVGNNNFLQYSLAKSNYPWYGIDYSGGQATGRFTNGRTIGDIICRSWISKLSLISLFSFIDLKLNKLCKPCFDGLILWHFAAAKLGIPSPPAYLSVSQNVDALLKGVNYASGGAGILNDTGLYFVSTTSSYPQDTVHRLKL